MTGTGPYRQEMPLNQAVQMGLVFKGNQAVRK